VPRRVLVTGLGVVSGGGADLATFWQRQLSGEARTRRVTRLEQQVTEAYAAEIDPADEAALMETASASLRRADRFTRLGTLAAQAAMRDAGLLPGSFQPARAGVVLGSGMGGLFFHEEQMWKAISSGEMRVHPHSVPRVSPAAVLTEVSLAHGLRGPGYVVTSACASSAHAIGQGLRLIQAGAADVMIVGGTEAPLTPFTFAAFERLGVMARGPAGELPVCRPFDKQRTGFVLGEGAGALVLEAEPHAQARGARAHAALLGYGQSLGAYHPVHARPDGSDAAAAITAALADGELQPLQVGYVNAHGTGTLENDRAESAALALALGSYGREIPVSSSKGIFGHTLGAAGALEAIVSCLALAHQVLPPSAGFEQADGECPLHILTRPHPARVEAALSNSFGFGNVNVSLLFARS
jgi:3-oxoacyl-[acyl-carrier-protein] synthase II